jgi:REP element-mobilizing transposase RayT
VEAKGWHSRGYLPHFDSQDTVQFVTFRLGDSLPAQIAAQLSIRDKPQSSTEEMLDRGLGACWLRRPEVARLVEEALLVFDGQRYRLLAWTIMPNHVHVLISIMPAVQLGQIVGSWKRFTAREANLLLRRTGSFWQVDYWDRFIRNDEHFDIVVNYIDLNPVKAGLTQEPQLWPWGSARFKNS